MCRHLALAGMLATAAIGNLHTVVASEMPVFEPYTEHLGLRQLADGKVLAQFAFTTIAELSNTAGQASHYRLLPRSIGEVFRAFDIKELHLSFTQGRWSYDRWGHSEFTAPSGVELWAWFNSTSPDAKWKGLTNALAGLFCSSLNFLDHTVTSEPLLSFLPQGDYGGSSQFDQSKLGMQIRYGSLPREAVCTENLTPWVKLLPCQAKAGIASLLNAYKIFDGNFQSIGVHLQPKCISPDCSTIGYEYKQTFAVMLDPIRNNGHKDWSLETLFGRAISKACPFASSSIVHLDIPELKHNSAVSYPVAQIDESTPTSISKTYHISDQPFEMGVRWKDGTTNYRNPKLSPITTHRYLSGVGQERGGIVIDFINCRETPMSVTYLESIPWIIKLFMHTFKVESNTTSANASAIVRQMYYQPAIDRMRANVLELAMTLPPKSKVTLSVDYDYTFLKYTEHHPDANHGFELGYGVLSLVPEFELIVTGNLNQLVDRRRIYTESLLVRLPTPDFSMPYNVITLTCTLFALFFGSLFNALTREFRPVEMVSSKLSVRQRIGALFRRFIPGKAAIATESKAVVDETESKDVVDKSE
ncbi:hypothetical protein BASA60_002713 [Batrachochytrium salamandrivorans]|nr:hypothetical protein BASA62_002608 [Batrachochytrium salamandrivorans]KAH6580846.1 hypothetical protein BASA60_002713 [Batrachochytrium salamandrivorans]